MTGFLTVSTLDFLIRMTFNSPLPRVVEVLQSHLEAKKSMTSRGPFPQRLPGEWTQCGCCAHKDTVHQARK